jgi:hypothetical protein
MAHSVGVDSSKDFVTFSLYMVVLYAMFSGQLCLHGVFGSFRDDLLQPPFTLMEYTLLLEKRTFKIRNI